MMAFHASFVPSCGAAAATFVCLCASLPIFHCSGPLYECAYIVDRHARQRHVGCYMDGEMVALWGLL